MRLIHLSDLHLGFRQFQRQTAAGINQREADVAKSFARAIDRIIEVAPEVVLVGGDVFHTVRPTNTSILHAFNQFARLVQALPQTKVVIAAGNHDMPRSSETVCILRLFAAPLGIHVADREAKRFAFEDLDLSVLAVPDLPPGTVDFAPDPEAKYNVLLLHGEVTGAIPQAAKGENPDRAAMQIPVEDVARTGWDYVALGHYHVYTRIAEHVYYSGSLDYTSTNPWGELAAEKAAKLPGKGMIERDLATGKQTFHPLPVSRPFIDLPAVDGRGMSAADLDAQIQKAADRVPDGIDGKVLRLVITNVPRHIAREIDHKALRELQRRALNFQLDTRRPQVVRQRGTGAPGRRPSLAETLRESLAARALPNGVSRDEFLALGLRYLDEAEQSELARALPGGDP
ncbi:MAG: DNA repair exonuclease [Gemmatimonadaceae bacterium]|nr:DNA repair exonuclease [Gemmatimonadaceae bacterium]